jgi:hypothetical protein
MHEPRIFEDALWDSIGVALGTSATIDATFDKKVLLFSLNRMCSRVLQFH